jgi:hypothetical protein
LVILGLDPVCCSPVERGVIVLLGDQRGTGSGRTGVCGSVVARIHGLKRSACRGPLIIACRGLHEWNLLRWITHERINGLIAGGIGYLDRRVRPGIDVGPSVDIAVVVANCASERWDRRFRNTTVEAVVTSSIRVGNVSPRWKRDLGDSARHVSAMTWSWLIGYRVRSPLSGTLMLDGR